MRAGQHQNRAIHAVDRMVAIGIVGGGINMHMADRIELIELGAALVQRILGSAARAAVGRGGRGGAPAFLR
jgi:hypothetical protein